MNKPLCLLIALATAVATLASCGPREGAIRAVVTLADQKATCVALKVREGAAGPVLEEVRLARAPGQDRLVVAIFRGDLPDSITLSAAPLFGDGCAEPSFANGTVRTQQASFPKEGIEEVVLALTAPSAQEDADGDGISGTQAGGADCDDAAADAYPGAPEACTTTRDLNCNEKVGCADPVCANLTCARVPSALAFVTPERTVTAGVCSPPLTVETRDEAGQPLAMTAPLPVSIEEAASVAQLFSDAACSDPVEAVTIASGESRATFFLRSIVAGDKRVRATLAGVQPVEQDATVTAGPPAAVLLEAPRQPVIAGVCSPSLTVRLADHYGNTAPAEEPVLVTLNAFTGSAGLFAATGDCTTPVSALAFAAGVGTMAFKIRGTTAQDVIVQAEADAAGLLEDARAYTIQPGAPASLGFLTDAHSVRVRTCSPPLTVRTSDGYGNLAPVSAATELTLSHSGLPGFALFSDPGCTVPAPKLQMAPGDALATFYFRSTAPGSATVQVSGPGLGNTSQVQTVTPPLVRSGTCTISANASTSGNCLISPALTELGRTVLFYQATAATGAADASSVICTLETDKVACARAGNAGVVSIAWYAAELPVGASVQRAAFSCSNNTSSLPWTLPNPVPASESFVLLNGRRGGPSNVESVFTSAQLATTGTEVNLDTVKCFHDQRYEVQVVHLPGASVTRGQVAGFGTSPTRVMSLSTVDRTRTFLLYSATATTTAPDRLCERMPRARLDTDTSIEFFRGAGATECDDNTMSLEWQRVELPEGNRVQEHQVAAGTQATLVQQIDPVDQTRALAFTGAHGSTGQGGGEGGLAATDPGELRARLTFEDADTLRLTRGPGAPAATATFGVYVLELAEPL